MSLRASYRNKNVDLTINKLISDNFETGAYVGKVFYEDSLADPTAMDTRITTLRYWVEVNIISHGMGQKVPTIVQIDCYYTTGDRTNQALPSDRYGHKTSEIADDFVAAMTVSNTATRILDFTVPASPTNTDDWLIARSPLGGYGWPAGRTRIPNDRGLIREVLTYHFWHMQDLSGVQGYF